MKKVFLGGGILIGILILLIIGKNTWYEVQTRKVLGSFVGSEQMRRYLVDGVFRDDLECYPETGTTVLKTSCTGISYEVSDEVCQKLKSELLSKNEQCGAYEWLETSFKNKQVQFVIENSRSKEGKTVTFLVE